MKADRRAAEEPKAEQAPHPKAPLAKPKPKPKPQPQAHRPPSPPRPPLVARKGAAALEEPAEVEAARGELKGFLHFRAASRAAKTRAETMEEEASVKDEEEETKVVEAAPAGCTRTNKNRRVHTGLSGATRRGVSRFGGWGPAGTAGSHGRSWRAPAALDPINPLSQSRVPPTGCWGRGGGYGWRGGGLSTWTSPCAWGWSRGRGGGNVSCRGRGISGGGRCPPPPRKGGEDV